MISSSEKNLFIRFSQKNWLRAMLIFLRNFFSQLTKFFALICRTFYPWIEDETCDKFGIAFSKTPLSPVGLVSYPSSGNTWMRYLVESITGIFSGSMYNDIALLKKGKSHLSHSCCTVLMMSPPQ